MAIHRQSDSPGAEGLQRRLDAAHAALLRVHKTIIDHERTRYERARGSLSGPLEFLQLVLHDPWFAWLRPISELIAQIDAFTMSREPTEPQQGEAVLKQARDLLAPSESGSAFAREYSRAMQESPDVAIAHGQWRRAVELQ
ncbi:MAG TPA: hypothetical protein VGR35_20190 [Tepidisphaeraceae bacterium]|nr:hypothetical protein [Tepidisphaeraceae bacterium]